MVKVGIVEQTSAASGKYLLQHYLKQHLLERLHNKPTSGQMKHVICLLASSKLCSGPYEQALRDTIF